MPAADKRKLSQKALQTQTVAIEQTKTSCETANRPKTAREFLADANGRASEHQV